MLNSAILAFLLASCATPENASTKKPSQHIIIEKNGILSSQLSAQQYLQSAAQVSTQQAIPLLINASAAYFEEESYLKSLWVANQVSPLLHNPLQHYQLAIIKADNLVQLNKIEQAYQQLRQAQLYNQEHNIKHSLRYLQVHAIVQKQRGLIISSLDSSLRAFSMNDQADDETVSAIWYELSHLSQWQLQQLTSLNPPYIKGWQQILIYGYQFGHEQQRFHRYLTQWQRKYPNHPANAVVKKIKEEPLFITTKIKNIAVILPLSGIQEPAGSVAQQGIIAAYNNDEEITLHFIDSNETEMATLPITFHEKNIDYVIGPLLKKNVHDYLNIIDNATPTLLLNISSTLPMNENHVALSMRREDEAIQAATTLSKQKFKHPIVFSLADNVSKRVAKSFAQQWYLSTNQQPEIVYFDKSSEMQQLLKDSLDVNQSQKRIRSLELRIRQKIKTEARNRRDIDMIYLVASPTATRLLKPYIDVNISTYASLIPIFASSLSHSGKVDPSERKDLSGLTFTEMPWLLTSKYQDKTLAEVSHKLWPERSDSLQRIFAMGFDSVNLVKKIPAMKAAPYIRHFGQTGTLKLDTQNILTRSLLWGKYEQGEVQEIVME
ncbi:MAG: outer membrane PBP1 activator LpoA protein [Alteromonadaceae bacterium]|jgi:outer membrane PBP1 activator LpoA protein